MSIYVNIMREVFKTSGYIPQSSWIAQVLAERGMTSRLARNRRHPQRLSNPCPMGRRQAIERAVEKLHPGPQDDSLDS
jgi:hypothetical protein